MKHKSKSTPKSTKVLAFTRGAIAKLVATADGRWHEKKDQLTMLKRAGSEAPERRLAWFLKNTKHELSEDGTRYRILAKSKPAKKAKAVTKPKAAKPAEQPAAVAA